MRKIVFSFFAFLLALSFGACDFISANLNSKDNPAAGRIPEPTGEYVNDYANLFTQDEIENLTVKIDNIYKKKDAQILVVTTPDLGDYTISDYAQRVGEKWGVGGASTDRGLVIVIKPKNETRGEAFVATGYGLEGELPDVRCKVIVSDKMVPYFKQNNYYGAVVNALDYIRLLLD